MQNFINANKGATAEVTFMMSGVKEQMVGKIQDVQDDIILLDVDGNLLAGNLENVLFVKILSDADIPESPETNISSGSVETRAEGQNVSPSLGHISSGMQTILP